MERSPITEDPSNTASPDLHGCGDGPGVPGRPWAPQDPLARSVDQILRLAHRAPSSVARPFQALVQ
eukprot:5596734-Pyramimonas_sp.AAC.1